MAKRLMVLLGMLALALTTAVPALARGEVGQYGGGEVSATGVIVDGLPADAGGLGTHSIQDEATGSCRPTRDVHARPGEAQPTDLLPPLDEALVALLGRPLHALVKSCLGGAPLRVQIRTVAWFAGFLEAHGYLHGVALIVFEVQAIVRIVAFREDDQLREAREHLEGAKGHHGQEDGERDLDGLPSLPG